MALTAHAAFMKSGHQTVSTSVVAGFSAFLRIRLLTRKYMKISDSPDTTAHIPSIIEAADIVSKGLEMAYTETAANSRGTIINPQRTPECLRPDSTTNIWNSENASRTTASIITKRLRNVIGDNISHIPNAIEPMSIIDIIVIGNTDAPLRVI